MRIFILAYSLLLLKKLKQIQRQEDSFYKISCSFIKQKFLDIKEIPFENINLFMINGSFLNYFVFILIINISRLDIIQYFLNYSIYDAIVHRYGIEFLYSLNNFMSSWLFPGRTDGGWATWWTCYHQVEGWKLRVGILLLRPREFHHQRMMQTTKHLKFLYIKAL